jgi:hypothetical protein
MKTNILVAGAVAMTLAVAANAEDTAKKTPEFKPIVDLRLRTENVDQDGIVNDAHATTLRARLGVESSKALDTAFLIEGEAILPIQNDYRPDPAVATMTAYPVVADAEEYEINRFQLTNTSLPGTTLTLGRQRILLDDQRFVGNSGWRQNEQTFDALRAVNKSVKNLVLDLTYLNRVNRVNGPSSPQGAYKGDSFLLNAGYQTKAGKLTAFGYLLDFDPITTIPAALNPIRDSTSTYGLRFAGDRPVGKAKVTYAASYAQQTDYADNPLDFDLDYVAADVGVTVKQFGFGVGTEILEGNGLKGFSTPLGTLHKFQGWDDKFLATPADGLEDLYATASVSLKKVGVFDTLGLVVTYHEYETDRTSLDFGDELNLSVAAKIGKANLMLKYADYQEGGLGSPRDTQKLWGQLEFVW